MWNRYRKWKLAVVPVLAGLALLMIQQSAEWSNTWKAGVVLGVGLGLAYVIEEVVWGLRGTGRPCVHCGHPLVMKAFRVRNTCSNCGEPL